MARNTKETVNSISPSPKQESEVLKSKIEVSKFAAKIGEEKLFRVYAFNDYKWQPAVEASRIKFHKT